MELLHKIRGWVMPVLVVLGLVFALLGAFLGPGFYAGVVVIAPLLLIGIFDLLQRRHSILRNYPVLGHLRFLLEGTGPELHQYFVESNTSGRPFDRDQRTLMYRRAKNLEGIKPFGTELDVYAQGYGFVSQSITPRPVVEDAAKNLRVTVGGPDCKRPYSASVVNVSAMSFGALSANAIRAINTGARMGGFAHDTGEGGFSRYHKEPGGDIIWEIGTGYFGCRKDDGSLDIEMFADEASVDQVKMVELKISQGAKPGHGGILPAVKVTPEIAAARKVPAHQDCISPPGHSAFSTPTGLLELIAELRERCGGKPVGFKLCVGNEREFFAICKAMIETGITPDFITVDGGEGGTGAAPIEFSDHLGMPLREGLMLVHNTLLGIGLRDRIRIAASGKLISSYKLATAMALGANWCNIARGFMFATGCLQSQSCHSNRCPVGVATQDPRLMRGLVVEEKAQRVYQFHRNTVQGLAEMTAACGLAHPNEFSLDLIFERTGPHEVRRLDKLYPPVEQGHLLEVDAEPELQQAWDEASASTFGRGATVT
jgi:glutamate synthase domain-containing protein 2